MTSTTRVTPKAKPLPEQSPAEAMSLDRLQELENRLARAEAISRTLSDQLAAVDRTVKLVKDINEVESRIDYLKSSLWDRMLNLDAVLDSLGPANPTDDETGAWPAVVVQLAKCRDGACAREEENHD